MTVVRAESDPGHGPDPQPPAKPTAEGPAGGPAGGPAAPAHRPLPQLDHSIAPRKPRTLGGVVYLGVLAATLAGIAVVVLGRMQTGLSAAGGALLVGAFARLVLPPQQAGMLGVRRKLIDVVTMASLGAALLFVAAVIREPAS